MRTPSTPDIYRMTDDELLDAIAAFAGPDRQDPSLFEPDELIECLAFSNEVFSRGRLSGRSRSRARTILVDLRDRAAARNAPSTGETPR